MNKGFTLSELLVSLAVLGLIAAFAIPKVLTSVGDSSTLAVIKESMAIVSQAYDQIKAENNGFVSTAMNNSLTTGIASKINYVSSGLYTESAAGVADLHDTATACTASNLCGLRLQNGAIIQVKTGDSFAVTPAGAVDMGCIVFNIDVDGTGATYKRVSLVLGYDGRLFFDDAAGTNIAALAAPFTRYGAGAADADHNAIVATNANYAPFVGKGLF
jgi:prepilin-type N-terminal cleavage/methylation domain-containing protein